MAPAAALIIGAGQGIGLGFVQQLLADGVPQVWATYRRPQSATELLALADGNPRLTCFALDLLDEGQIAQRIDQIRQSVAAVPLVINCVGLLHDGDLQPEKALRQLEADQLAQYFAINSIGPALLAKHLLPLVQGCDRSLFATLSAKLGSIGDNHLGGWYGYRASKAALNMLIRTAAVEYRRKSPNTILVTLHPGTTDTRLSAPFQRNVPPEKLFPVDRTVSQLLAVLADLTPADSGHFFNWDGSRLPW
jgi:NAD(P)-dependent dehydrogenase (short-subunit alcohol dehydrogenase family)